MLTAILFAGSRYLIMLYLEFSTANEVYGAAGSLVILLVWVYIMAMVVFYGAAFSHAFSVTYGSRSESYLNSDGIDQMIRESDDKVESLREEKLNVAKRRLQQIIQGK